MSLKKKLSKLKRKNPKIKIVQLKRPVDKMFKKPLKGDFIKIDDPNYEIDEIFSCY